MAHTGDRARWSDQELLSAVADRDGEAFAVFYRRYLPATVAYLLRETHDSEAAADLTAEVFASVMLAALRYRPEKESALPWVMGIARNTLLLSRRRFVVEDRARRRLGFEPLELEDGDLERTEAIADSCRGRLDELVHGLPAAERTAVTLRVVDERTYSEIARELRCSEMVVRKRVSRGLSRLRRGLGEG
jgi:RNA polymerase sigma factor (sigma-70 family)